MLDAVRTVRAPLAQFYELLSDEQKARFNSLGKSEDQTSRRRGAISRKCAANALPELPGFRSSGSSARCGPTRHNAAPWRICRMQSAAGGRALEVELPHVSAAHARRAARCHGAAARCHAARR